MTKEEAQKEINKMISTYKNRFNSLIDMDGKYCGGFLTGSSLCGNEEGDSARFSYLKSIINEINKAT